jgi:hypothetical protein
LTYSHCGLSRWTFLIGKSFYRFSLTCKMKKGGPTLAS